MVKKPIRVLNVEDSERDVILLTRHLDAAGYEPVSERVETAAAMKKALEDEEWDIILCDYSMPRFNALNALKILRQLELDIPFIIISGTVGEEVAVQAMLTGADDYLPKDNLTRLVPAIERELHQAENRREQKRIKKERRVVFEIIQGSIAAPNLDEFLKLVHRSIGQIVYAENCIVMLHDPATDTFEYDFWADERDPPSPPRPVGNGFSSYVLRTGRPLLLTKELKKELVDRGEAILSGTPSLSWVGIPLRTPARTIGVLVLQHYEAENAYSQHDLEFLSSIGNQIALAIERKRGEDALGESEERYRSVVETAPDVIITIDESSTICFVNPAAERVFGYGVEDMKGASLTMLMPEYLRHLHTAGIERYQQNGHKRVSWDYVELTGLHSSGREIPIALSFSEFTQHGRRYFTGIIRDISESKQATEALAKSEQRYRDLVENAIDIIYTHDLAGNITSVNKAGEKITGYTQAEALTMNFAEIVAPEDRERAGRLLAAKLAGEAVTPYDLEIIGKDGGRVAVEINTRILYENGVPVGVQGIARDITERKRTEAALEEREASFKSLFDTANDAIMILSDGVFLDCNARAEEMFGRSKQDIIGRSPMDLSPLAQPDGRKTSLSVPLYISPALEGIPQFFEWQHLRSDGTLFDAEVSLNRVTLRGALHLQAIIRDITERKLAAEELQRQQTELRVLFDLMPAMIWFKDTKNNILRVNQRVAEAAGMAIEDIEGKTSMEIYPNEAAKFYVDDRAVIESGNPKLGYVETVPGADGRDIWVQTDKVPYFDKNGEAIGIVVMAQDVTERKLTEDALSESEDRYRSLFETSPDGIGMFDLGMKLLVANARSVEIFGYANAAEMVGKNAFDLIAPEYLERARGNIDGILKSGRLAPVESVGLKADGSRFAVEFSATLIRNADKQPTAILGVTRDITDRKKAEEALQVVEEQLRQSQKMEAVGALAGGIAHDFNNLLTAINGYSDLTLKKMATDDPLRQNIKEVREAGHRAAELIAQLLAFSRKQVLKPRVYNLNAAITEIDRMLRRIMRENVELRTALDPDLGNIKADAGQIEQVIMNLAVNARDAMADGGTLTIETKNVYLDDAYMSQHLMISPGKFVRMTVTDTGHGMDEKVQRHIFEPFFTTKDVGKGTGLGLSTVYGIIKQSGGDIMVYSEVGHGSTFKVYLPCVDQLVEKPRWVGENVEKYSGTETILLAEDEEVVRNLVREVLVSNGYNVLEAASGKAALAVCDTHPEPIHMLLTDVVMPKMSGRELRDQVIKLHPDIKVLFMSGYTDDAVAHRGVFDSHNEFIEKPFTPDSLARKVREVLEY